MKTLSHKPCKRFPEISSSVPEEENDFLPRIMQENDFLFSRKTLSQVTLFILKRKTIADFQGKRFPNIFSRGKRLHFPVQTLA